MQLTTYYVLVETVVACYSHAVDARLRTFLNTHLNIDRVAYDVYIHRLKVVEYVTVVPVSVAYSILVQREALVHELLVIDVAGLHTENILQC